MYAQSITADLPKKVKRIHAGSDEMFPLINLVNIIYAQLQYIRSRSNNGSVLNEILERTEVMAYNAKAGHSSVLSLGNLKDYQKNLWQQLAELDEADVNDGLPSNLKEHKAIFYYLFENMDEIIDDLRSRSRQSAHPYRSITTVN